MSSRYNIIEIFNHLDMDEITSFRPKIGKIFKPQYSSTSEVLLLFDFLFTQKKLGKLSDFNKNTINSSSKHMKKKKIYNMDKTMYDLNKIIQNCLLFKIYFENPINIQTEIDLLDLLNKKNSIKQFNSQLKKISKIIAQMENPGLAYEYQFKTSKIVFMHNAERNKQKDSLQVEEAIVNLDKYYIFERLFFENQYLIQKYLTKFNSTDEFIIPNIPISAIERLKPSDSIIKILFEINNSLKASNLSKEYILTLNSKLEKIKSTISSEWRAILFGHIRNIATMQFNKGLVEYKSFIFDLQVEHLKNGYLHFNGQISPSTFTNIANFGLKLGRYEWVRDFILTYQKDIAGETPNKGYFKSAYSRYLFAIKNFKESIENIPFDLEEPIYVNISKRLEIKNYFECQSNLLQYKMDAFKMHVSRLSTKISTEDDRTFQLNFINILFQITASIPGDKKRAVAIIRRILQKRTVADKEWLLEKARELGRLSDEEYEMAIQMNE